jgi:hypothetical protein
MDRYDKWMMWGKTSHCKASIRFAHEILTYRVSIAMFCCLRHLPDSSTELPTVPRLCQRWNDILQQYPDTPRLTNPSKPLSPIIAHRFSRSDYCPKQQPYQSYLPPPSYDPPSTHTYLQQTNLLVSNVLLLLSPTIGPLSLMTPLWSLLPSCHVSCTLFTFLSSLFTCYFPLPYLA